VVVVEGSRSLARTGVITSVVGRKGLGGVRYRTGVDGEGCG
jgi:hypothetical protein